MVRRARIDSGTEDNPTPAWLSSRNETVFVTASDDAQTKIEDSGDGANIVFESGTHQLSSPLKPQPRQTWYLPYGALLIPSGDNRVVEIDGVNDVRIHGTVNIDDSSENMSSASAVYISDTTNTVIDQIQAYNVFGGLLIGDTTLSDDTTDIVSCRFGHIRMADHRGDAISLQNEIRDVKFGSTILRGTKGTSSRGIVVNTAPSGEGATDGGLYFEDIITLDQGSHGMHIESLSLGLWMGSGVFDNCDGNGLRVDGDSRRIMMGNVWAAANAEHGVFFNGSSGTPVEYVQISNLETTLNNTMNFAGLRMEYLQDSHFGSVISWDNGQALHFGSGGNESIHFGHIRTFSNNAGVFASGIESDVVVDSPQIDDGLDPTDWTRLGNVGYEAAGVAQTPTGSQFRNGDIVHNTSDDVVWARVNNTWVQIGFGAPIDLTANNGIQNGQVAIADGTSASASDGDIATWDSAVVQWNIFNADATE